MPHEQRLLDRPSQHRRLRDDVKAPCDRHGDIGLPLLPYQCLPCRRWTCMWAPMRWFF